MTGKSLLLRQNQTTIEEVTFRHQESMSSNDPLAGVVKGGTEHVVELLLDGKGSVTHGSLSRFPSFLQPDKGALSGIRKLNTCRQFDITRRESDKAVQTPVDSDANAIELYEAGYMVHHTGLVKVSAELRDWLWTFSPRIGIPTNRIRVQSWAAKKDRGIQWHFDPVDQIHFQISGQKHLWLLYVDETRYADMWDKLDEPKLVRRYFDSIGVYGDVELARQVTLGPGSLTVLPRGVWHRSIVVSEESFAVSMALDAPSIASAIGENVAQNLRTRMSYKAPVIGETNSRIRSLKTVRDDFLETLSHLSMESIALASGALSEHDFGRYSQHRVFISTPDRQIRGHCLVVSISLPEAACQYRPEVLPILSHGVRSSVPIPSDSVDAARLLVNASEPLSLTRLLETGASAENLSALLGALVNLGVLQIVSDL